MCVKLPPRDWNPGPCPPHSTSTYICRMTTTPRVRGGHDATMLACCKSKMQNGCH